MMPSRPILLLLIVFATPVALAQVHRADNGLGGALILPYWTAAKNNDTLLSIRNEGGEASAAKVRLLDAEGGLVQSFNLYLDAGAVWTAGITQSGGTPEMIARDTVCMLPASLDSEPGSSTPVVALDSPQGSVEVIEMASATNDAGLVSSGRWAECAELAGAFETGGWSDSPNEGLVAPAQRLSASASIINVPVGSMNVVNATALGGFSDIAQHTAPEAAGPDLSSAFDSESPQGGTRSRVCTASGCRTDDWDRPVQAVAAALTVSTMRADYSVRDTVLGEFDWMVHRPLERYESDETGFVIDVPPTLTIRDRSGALPDVGDFCLPEPPPGSLPCGQDRDFPLGSGLIQQNLAFNATPIQDGSTIESAVLGHPTTVQPAFALGGDRPSALEEGTAEFRFDAADENAQLLVAGDGTVFVGEPVVSFAVQQFTNGTLIDSQDRAVLANYRGTESPRTILRLESPE
jgi:hypothetical protein